MQNKRHFCAGMGMLQEPTPTRSQEELHYKPDWGTISWASKKEVDGLPSRRLEDHMHLKMSCIEESCRLSVPAPQPD